MRFLALFLNDFSQSKSSECNKRWEHGWPSGSFNKWLVNLAGAEVLKPLKSPYKEMITEYIRLPPPPPYKNKNKHSHLEQKKNLTSLERLFGIS